MTIHPTTKISTCCKVPIENGIMSWVFPICSGCGKMTSTTSMKELKKKPDKRKKGNKPNPHFPQI